MQAKLGSNVNPFAGELLTFSEGLLLLFGKAKPRLKTWVKAGVSNAVELRQNAKMCFTLLPFPYSLWAIHDPIEPLP
jgi:hypothetical protein